MAQAMETFMIKSPKGRECKIGIRKQYEFDELILNHIKPFGKRWIIIHRRYGYKVKWNERVEWLDRLDDRTPEEVLDYLYDKYGTGFAWGFVEEVAVRA